MNAKQHAPIISMVGKSGVGKTTALELVIPELKRRGYRVGTVKHDAHGFDLDTPGKDSWRHAQAGSDAVVISAPHKVALIRKLDQEMTLDEIPELMGDLDLIITEGYKRGDKPKIEVTRLAEGTDLLCQAGELIGIMADYPVDMPVPQFALDDASGVVDLLEKLYLGGGGGTER
jgi:molybdopterin-guanine dinucleotide biosynthesis protein B